MNKLSFILIYTFIVGSFGTILFIHNKQYKHCKYTITNSNGNFFRVVSYKKINENCIKAYDRNNAEITMCGEYTITPR
jgi:hypothetical protein